MYQPDVSNGRWGRVRGGGHCTVKSNLNKFGHFQGWGVSLYSEVQCIMGNGHMGPPSHPVDRQTPVKTLLSRREVAGGNKMSALGFIYIFEIIRYD